MTNLVFSGNSSSSGTSVSMLSEEDARAKERGSGGEATGIIVRWQQSRKRVSMVQQLFYGLLVILISLTGKCLESPISSAGIEYIYIVVSHLPHPALPPALILLLRPSCRYSTCKAAGAEDDGEDDDDDVT